MAAAYDPNVLAQALAVASRFGATPRERKALVEAGLVESGLRNLNYGDRDSVGFLQQRPSQGWTGLTNVGKAAAEFLTHARGLTHSGFKGSAGELAQAVQGSAFPGRYDEQSGQAQALLRGVGGAGGGGSVTLSTGSDSSAPADSGGGIDAAVALLQAAQQQKPVIQSAGIQAPAFSARPVMPQGAQLPQAGGGPQPASPGLDQLLQVIASSQGQGATPSASQGSVSTTVPLGGAGGALAAGGGSVRVAPSADRPGLGLTPGILKVVRAISAQAGQPLTIGTGTNHSRLTVNGRVSEHWSGNAADIPSSGTDLTRLGQEALIAAGMDPAQARKQKGGLFNLPYGRNRRIQVIFNTNEGGDHYNHLHVGVTGLRR